MAEIKEKKEEENLRYANNALMKLMFRWNETTLMYIQINMQKQVQIIKNAKKIF